MEGKDWACYSISRLLGIYQRDDARAGKRDDVLFLLELELESVPIPDLSVQHGSRVRILFIHSFICDSFLGTWVMIVNYSNGRAGRSARGASDQ